jgi:hypothetical protein
LLKKNWRGETKVNKNTYKKILSGTATAAILMTTSAFASSYTAYSLGPLKQNNYTSAHTKQTSDQYMRNHVTAMSNTDLVTFWGCNANKSQISPDYDQKVGSTVDIRYNTKQSAGTQVILGMENAHNYLTEYAFVSGDVDFR